MNTNLLIFLLPHLRELEIAVKNVSTDDEKRAAVERLAHQRVR